VKLNAPLKHRKYFAWYWNWWQWVHNYKIRLHFVVSQIV